MPSDIPHHAVAVGLAIHELPGERAAVEPEEGAGAMEAALPERAGIPLPWGAARDNVRRLV